MSCRVVSCHVVLCYVVSCRVVLCYVVSCRVMSCRVVSCLVVSYLVVSCRVGSCRAVSCRIVYSFRAIHSFSVLPFPLILVPLSKRQRRVSNMSRLGWILTNSNLTMTKLRHWLSVLALGQVSATVRISRLVVGRFLFSPRLKVQELS